MQDNEKLGTESGHDSQAGHGASTAWDVGPHDFQTPDWLLGLMILSLWGLTSSLVWLKAGNSQALVQLQEGGWLSLTLARQAHPIPVRQAQFTPTRQAHPIPAWQAHPILVRRAQFTPTRQVHPIPARQANPTPARRAHPSPHPQEPARLQTRG